MSSGRCAEIANARLHGSLDELRTCLFFEQRRWRHFGESPDNESMAYIREVVEKIRARVVSGSGEIPAGEPGTGVDTATTDPIALPGGWYRLVVAEGVDQTRPGIYEWRIEGVGIYIGKYKRIGRPTREYGKNVVNLLNGRPYRRGKPDGYRLIHRNLAEAHLAGRRITLTILENACPADIDRRERELIAERGTLNGPLV